ncbi:MAG: Hsp20/alpha crystallin family protein [Planctomycetes bacterium]|nr:Hsp20/alpha crystallin family protein [Planctomycetota bacterium]
MSTLMRRRSNTLPGLFRRMWDPDMFEAFMQNDASMPAMNVVEKANEFAIDISVPGFNKEDINVSVDKNVLSIKAESKKEDEQKDSEDRIIRQEFMQTSFERNFSLPDNVDTGKIAAKQENGVLKITLPKMENAPEDQVKKIEVS